MIISIVDIETSGVDPKRAEIIEIGVVVFDSESFNIIDTMDVKVMPMYPASGDPKAYEVNGFNLGAWKDAVKISVAIRAFAKKTMDTIFCAHNPLFDWSFIEKASKDNNVDLRFVTYHKLDLYSLAWRTVPEENMKSLATICEYLGVEPEAKPHRALNGAMKGYEVYKILMKK